MSTNNMYRNIIQVHFPYGFKKVKNRWIPFNKENSNPLSRVAYDSSVQKDIVDDLPPEYFAENDIDSFLDNETILKIVKDESSVERDSDGNIIKFWLYKKNILEGRNDKEVEEKIALYLDKLNILFQEARRFVILQKEQQTRRR